MKLKILILFFFLTYLTSKSQTIQLKIIGKTTAETKIIDSIGYSAKQQNAKQVVEEINIISKKLKETGYINNQILEKKKENDSSYIVKMSLEKQIKNIHIYIGIKNDLFLATYFDIKQDSIKLSYSQIWFCILSYLCETFKRLKKSFKIQDNYR